MDPKKQNMQPGVAVNLNVDTTPILYTDNIMMTTNEDGLVLNFCQNVGPNQMKIVARIGMSRSHAKKFAKEMGRLIAMTDGSIQTGKKN